MAIELYRTAPNGMKTDIVYLLEVPNADFSGVEYRIS